MAWAKIDDRFFSHPKVRRAGKDAVLLYLAGLTYCNEHLTDGFISEDSLPLLGLMAFVDDAKQSASKLLDVGLWDVSSKGQAAGYTVHDYFDHNPTREQVELTKAARAEAGSKGGKASVASKSSKSQANPQAKSKQTSSNIPSPIPINGCAPSGAPPSEHQQWFGAICAVIGADPKTLSDASCKEITDCEKALLKGKYTRDDLALWFRDYWPKEFPGRKGERPTVKHIRDKIGIIRAAPPAKKEEYAAEVY